MTMGNRQSTMWSTWADFVGVAKAESKLGKEISDDGFVLWGPGRGALPPSLTKCVCLVFFLFTRLICSSNVILNEKKLF